MCFKRVISINTKIRSLRDSLPQNGYSQFEPPPKKKAKVSEMPNVSQKPSKMVLFPGKNKPTVLTCQ